MLALGTMPSQVSTCVVPIVRPTLLTPLHVAVPESIGELQALTELYLNDNSLSGACLCSTSTTPHKFLHHRRREGPREGSPPQLRGPLPLARAGARAARGNPARGGPPAKAGSGACLRSIASTGHRIEASSKRARSLEPGECYAKAWAKQLFEGDL